MRPIHPDNSQFTLNVDPLSWYENPYVNRPMGVRDEDPPSVGESSSFVVNPASGVHVCFNLISSCELEGFVDPSLTHMRADP